jgi:hypothetical protein
MPFLPIGPDFVFAPRERDFKRLSLRNEFGAQGLVQSIAVASGAANRLYAVVRPATGGTSVHRTDDGGASWTSLFDEIMLADFDSTQATCITIDPSDPNRVFVGCDQPLIWVSTDAGSSWVKREVGDTGNVRKILVDPRSAGDPASTVLLAATSQGVFRSTDGGATFTRLLDGAVFDVAASFASDEAYYASMGPGLFFATDPAGPWINLNAQNIGLPSKDDESFSAVLIALCRSSPHRAYAVTATSGKTLGLFTSASPTTAWTSVASTSIPNPGQGFYSFGLAVTPNSPGDGSNDVLFFLSVHLHRSTDGGRTWVQAFANALHDDQHCVAFAPDPAPPGVIPATYVGCDGGIGVSDRYADAAYGFDMPDQRNAHDVYQPSGAIQNIGHGLQNNAILYYASDPSVAALSYIACQDTGLAAGSGALGWRALDVADGFGLAVSRGDDGMKAWFYFAVPNLLKVYTDKGGFQNPVVNCTLDGELMTAVSNMVVGLDKKALVGVWIRDDAGNQLTAAVSAPGTQPVTPASMAKIVPGVWLEIGRDTMHTEAVLVQATTATTFTADFVQTHDVGAPVVLQRFPIVRIDQGGLAVRISHDSLSPNLVAASPVDPNVLYAAKEGQLWVTNDGASTLLPTWTEITAGKPGGLRIVSITFDPAGTLYVLLRNPAFGELGVTSPLFKISQDTWIEQVVVDAPLFGYAKLAFHPLRADRCYASIRNRVYELTNGAKGWQWVDLSEGLPGTPIYDLWVGDVGAAGKPVALLRAAATARGIFERDVTDGAVEPDSFLYVRANFLDQRRLDVCPDNAENPYDPQNPAARVFHYQSADVKVDVRNAAGYGQAEPEGTLPLSHVLFDELLDTSGNLPERDAGVVHVQVHNRSRKPADNVQVWVLYANAAAGVPALSKSPSHRNHFSFWSQFQANGKIVPTLPTDSPWRAVGPPQTLSGITANRPQVASWSWKIPARGRSTGHYCLAVFVHSATNPLSDPSFDVDDLTRRRAQIGLKNLHVGPALAPSRRGPRGAGGARFRSEAAAMREYVEFHNPASSPRRVELVFDLRGLPAELEVSLQLSALRTAQPLAESISSARPSRAYLRRWLGELPDCARAIASLLRERRCPCLAFCSLAFACHCPLCKSCPNHQPTPIPLRATTYLAEPSSKVVIHGVDLLPFEAVAAGLVVRNTGSLPPGESYVFHVQQRVDERIVSGSEYRVRIAGQLLPLIPQKLDLPDVDKPNYPLAAREIIAQEFAFRGRTDEGESEDEDEDESEDEFSA